MSERSAKSSRSSLSGSAPAASKDDAKLTLQLSELRRLVALLAPVLAPFLAQELAPLLPGRDNVNAADVSLRPGKEERKWRNEVKGSGSLDPIPSEDSGESSWSVEEAKEIVTSIRRKKKRGKLSARSGGNSREAETRR